MARITRENQQVTKLLNTKETVSLPKSWPATQSFSVLFRARREVTRSQDFNCARPVMVKGARLRKITQTVPEPPTPGGGLPSRWFLILLLAGGEEEDQGKSPSKRSVTHGRNLVRAPTQWKRSRQDFAKRWP